MSHVSIQVIAPVLTDFFHCMHCEQFFNQAGIGQQTHQEELDQYPEDVKQEVTRLANWLFDLSCRYGDQIQIRVVDAQSPEGLFKWDQEALDAVLQSRLASS
jgi:hypothetical protein